MILREEVSELLALQVDEEKAICFVLRKKGDASLKKGISLRDVIAITQNNSRFDMWIKELINTTV